MLIVSRIVPLIGLAQWPGCLRAQDVQVHKGSRQGIAEGCLQARGEAGEAHEGDEGDEEVSSTASGLLLCSLGPKGINPMNLFREKEQNKNELKHAFLCRIVFPIFPVLDEGIEYVRHQNQIIRNVSPLVLNFQV